LIRGFHRTHFGYQQEGKEFCESPVSRGGAAYTPGVSGTEFSRQQTKCASAHQRCARSKCRVAGGPLSGSMTGNSSGPTRGMPVESNEYA
jgi:hypothetical protein